MSMTDGALVERTLTDLLQTKPSDDGLRRLDAQIAQVLATRHAVATSRPRRTRRRTRVLWLVAAAALTMGAGGALGLYDGLGAGMDYGFSIQMARSVEIGASAVDDGFRVTVERAYLDGERLMLALRVEDELQRPEVSGLLAMYSVVSDGESEWTGAGIATARQLGPWVAANIQWRLAPGPVEPGIHRFHVDVPHIFWRDGTMPLPTSEDPDWNPWREQHGSWSFDIDVPVDGGATVIRPDTALDIGGTPFVLEDVVIGPSAVRVRLTYDDPGATWALIGEVQHEGRAFPFVLQSLGEAGVAEVQADGGVDDPSGDWTIVIREADRQVGDEPQRRVVGPWVVDLTAP
jgi:hypothetical protein